jgi:hypothetical protein
LVFLDFGFGFSFGYCSSLDNTKVLRKSDLP